jgi:thiamine-phosphate pyrophosphorylase
MSHEHAGHVPPDKCASPRQARQVKVLSDCLLYTFVDTAFLRGRKPAEVAQQLCDGGSDLIQLRAKTATPAEVRAMALEILPVAHRAGVRLVVNDNLAVANEVGADLCHLGQEDFFGAGYRHVSDLARNRSGVRLGLSTHGPEQAAQAVAAGADYIAVGPVYRTATKPSAQPVTLDYVRWATANVSLPWFAIGGISLANLEHVLRAGARRICVVSAILDASDPAKACREFKEQLLQAR